MGALEGFAFLYVIFCVVSTTVGLVLLAGQRLYQVVDKIRLEEKDGPVYITWPRDIESTDERRN